MEIIKITEEDYKKLMKTSQFADSVKASQRKWENKNKEKRKEYMRQWQRTHKEHLAEYRKQYKALTKEKNKVCL